MKNRFLFSAAIVAGVLVVGCDFLVRSPNGKESEAEFFKTQDQVNRALVAAYDVLGWQAVTETHVWFIGDIVSDDALKGGESPVDQGDVEQLREFNWSPSNTVLEDRWSALYQGINRANRVIENANKVTDLPDSTKTPFVAKAVAEAKFLRGFYYFELVNTFGAVPLVTSVLTADKYCSARAPKAMVWAQIEKDFSEAAADLPLKSATDLGRATKGAAQAYLVKAYVYQAKDAPEKWALAQALADTVINSGAYKLTTDYKDIFTTLQDNGDESIFDVQHTHVATGDWGDDNEGEVTSIFQGNRTSKYQEGWGFDDPTREFVETFDPGDPRLYSTVIMPGDTMWIHQVSDADVIDTAKNPGAEIADMSQSWSGYHSRKYLVDFIDPADEMSNDRKNWRAYRYADLLLYRAEAAIHNNDVAGGVATMNLVRARAAASTFPAGVANPPAKAALGPIVAATAPAALDSLYKERRRELGMEGIRYWDVVRRGQGAAEFNDTTGAGYLGLTTGRTFPDGDGTFPVPSIEAQLCTDLAKAP
jgi:hypothetical protein